jgi:hypothetical protein
MNEPMPPPPQAGSERWAEQPLTPEPAGAVAKRPGAVTAAGVLLIVSAAFSFLGALVLIGSSARPSLDGVGSARGFAIVLVIAGALNLVAGLLVLARSNAGRILAIVLAGLGILGALTQFGSATGFVSLAIDGFIVIALVTNADAFRRGSRR